MSITKPITLDTGATAEHWEITFLSEDMREGVVGMDVHGWLDAKARADGRDPLALRQLRFRVEDLRAAGVSVDLTAMFEPLMQGLLA